MLSPIATSSLIYGHSVKSNQEAVLKNTYWDVAENIDMQTANQDRLALNKQISAIQKLEEKLKNPEKLPFSERKATEEKLSATKAQTVSAIVSNTSLGEKELAQYAMSFNFEIDGNPLPSPDVFKTLREIQYNTVKNQEDGYVFSSIETSLGTVMTSYNDASDPRKNANFLFGLQAPFMVLPLMGVSTRNTPKPKLRDFKPKAN